ncbi:D-methionine transport system permease protein [Lachnotalea glycerini]|jgi:D-methionine transport system permease protein|uniref:ABC transporter permease n=1 Tax=Lachnotalea glycerini TaxID=1763509 RepID=A0A255JG09_9FIRM|nr:methionine ABC transporter permease [Lachnotalea glycerini]OYO51500.1 methionine ABC transporter permease [Lachnotalea glycerini]PXV86826.1 D-methionine transport system permease protein [Lachnotalea glycerini]RDY29585.1 ABC transporter permease [Lachnotalea glycerini]
MEFNQLLPLLLEGIKETLYMTVLSTVFSYLLGIPVGVILFITDKNGVWECKPINMILGIIVNLARSIPFIILLVAILPFTKAVVGTTIGSNATIVPLVVAAAPFIARMVQSSLKEVDAGVIEAALAMGSSPLQIIWNVLLPEARPSLMIGCTIAITTILGYSAMAGFVGGGGLGAIAVNYGYYRYQTNIMFITVALLVIIVQIFQEIGMKLANKTDKRIKNS